MQNPPPRGRLGAKHPSRGGIPAPMARTRSLRESLTWALVLISLIAVLAAATVGLSLGAIADTHRRLEVSSRSLRNADLSAITLLQELVEDDPDARAQLRRTTFVYLDRIRRLTVEPHELDLINETERAIARYYAVPHGDPRARVLLIEAFRNVFALSQLNIVQFNEALEEADAIARSTRVATLGAAVAVVGGLGLLVMGLRESVYEPFRELVRALESFRGGDLEVRLPERGPREVQAIASTFNTTASALQEQRATRTAFLAGVAHDLRNPLHALRLSLAVIRPDRPLPDEPRLRRVLDTVANQLVQLERMVGDLLEAQRVERGTPALELSPHDLRTLAADSLELHRSMSDRHRLELHVEEPVIAVCDGLRVQQILNNLIGNAIKYTPGGTVRVEVARDGESARVRVSDEGAGVPESERERVFRAYERGNAGAHGIEGTGLGLYVSRQIAVAHGGELVVESTPGPGATFTLRLPLAGPGAPAANPPAAAPSS